MALVVPRSSRRLGHIFLRGISIPCEKLKCARNSHREISYPAYTVPSVSEDADSEIGLLNAAIVQAFLK